MDTEKAVALLKGSIVLQAAITAPIEGDTAYVMMRRKHPDSTFLMFELLPLKTEPAPTVAVKGKFCKRGSLLVDSSGIPFNHERDPASKICIWCGDGSPAPTLDAYEKKPMEDRIETVVCATHGLHTLIVRPDGSYDKPDCDLFR